MALIKISNLTAESTATSDSFLTELQAADSSQIFGGTSYGYEYEYEKEGKEKEKKKEKEEKEKEGKKKYYSYYPSYYCY